MNIVAFDAAVARATAIDLGWLRDVPATMASDSWGAMFKDIGSGLAKDREAAARVEHFWRLFGPGQLFVFLGALMAEAGLIGGIIGGAKKNKADKKAMMMAIAEKKRK